MDVFPLTKPIAGLQNRETPNPAAPATVGRARKAAEEFEAFFLGQAFESMFSGLGGDKLFGAGSSEGVFRSLLVQEYGKEAARSGGVGIAEQVYREILRQQEAGR